MIGMSRIALPFGNLRGSPVAFAAAPGPLTHEGMTCVDPSSYLNVVVPSTDATCPYLRWLVWQTTQYSVSTRPPPWNASALWHLLQVSIMTMSRCGAAGWPVDGTKS